MLRRVLPLLLACVLGLAAAGCGSAGAQSSGAGTGPGELAADAWVAFQEAGSAHYAMEAEVRAEGGSHGGPYGFRAEGDASEEAFTVDATLMFPGGSFSGKLLAGPHEFFVNFLGTWYGTKTMGLADAAKKAAEDKSKEARLWRGLQTTDGIRAFFPRVFAGETVSGPEVEGHATWQFEGTLNVDGIAALQQEYGGRAIDREERETLETIAEALSVTMVYEQDTHRLRSLEAHAALSSADLGDDPPFSDADRIEFNAKLTLSDYGKGVSYEAPETFERLDSALNGLFGGLE